MTNDYPARDNGNDSPSGGMGLPDIYFILFRRKWFVIAGLFLGVIGALGVWKMRQPHFKSEAKLLVKYVLESRSPVLGPDAQVRNTDSSSENVINSEVEILRSLDVAAEAARILNSDRATSPRRPESIEGPGSTSTIAPAMILKNLRVETPNRGNIISLSFEHADPYIAQEALEQVIRAYLKKHQDIHRADDSMDDALIEQRNQLKSQLTDIEDQLKQSMAKAGVVSLEEAKKSYAEQITSIQQELFKAEAELAQQRAVLIEMGSTEVTNAVPAPLVETPPPAKLDEYRRVLAQVEALEQRERALLLSVTLENPQAQTNHLHLEAARRVKAKLEQENPSLLRAATPLIGTTPLLPGPANDPGIQAGLVRSLQAKVGFLTNELASVRAQVDLINSVNNAIIDLQRKRNLVEAQYLYLEKNLQQRKLDRGLESGKTTNISRVQAPSPPFRDFKSLYKKVGTVLFGGLAAGLALAFLIELFLDRTLKRPKEIETFLRAPLFLSIPILKLRKSRVRQLSPGKADPRKPPAGSNGKPEQLPGLHAPSPGLQPFHEALRDRLMNYFDVRQMTHKPKLIAVTGCAEGVGVSSIATGLAASLSETGDGNVLLVDMRGEQGAAHAFYHGKPGCGLVEALENDTRTSALVHENLYVVSGDSIHQESQKIIPRQFSNIIPKLKASDYDYIIFDMPPVGQTSITAKVARFMDMVLMVIESNRTDRDVARQAATLLTESKATVATILNKHRRYVPAWLQQDFQ